MLIYMIYWDYVKAAFCDLKIIANNAFRVNYFVKELIYSPVQNIYNIFLDYVSKNISDCSK